MNCYFPIAVMPAALQAHVAAAEWQTRSATLRQFAATGLDLVRRGLKLRERAALTLFASNKAEIGSLRVIVPDTSDLAVAMRDIASELDLGHGTVFMVLAILGWERFNAPQHQA